MAKKRILLVDDHPIVREGLRGLLERHDFTVCGEAGDVEGALAQIRDTRPDALTVDIGLGAESGLDLVRRARADRPQLAILVVSIHDEMIYAERALRAGANGYIMKHEAPGSLVDALRQVLGGKAFVGRAVSDRLVGALTKGRSTATSYSVDRLSDRELEVFRLVGRGVSSANISEQLNISQKTVETHRTRIKEKLGLSTATDLVISASSWIRDDQLVRLA